MYSILGLPSQTAIMERHLLTVLTNHVITVAPPAPLTVWMKSSKLGAPNEHLLELDSTSFAFQLQDTSCFEFKFVPEFEEHLDNANISQTGSFLNDMTMDS